MLIIAGYGKKQGILKCGDNFFQDIFETGMISQKFYLLPYDEQRLIRVYLASKVNVYQMLGLDKKTDNLSLVLK